MRLHIEILRVDTGEREELTCGTSPVRVGRSPLNNVVLKAPWVSLHHGLIHFDDTKISISDLGSTNGTIAVLGKDDKKLQAMVPVQVLGPNPGKAEVRIGAITLRFWREKDEEVLQPAPGARRDLETRLTMGDMRAYRDDDGRPASDPGLGPGAAPVAPADPSPSGRFAAGPGRPMAGEGPGVDDPALDPGGPGRPRRRTVPVPERGTGGGMVAGGPAVAPGGRYNAGMTRMASGQALPQMTTRPAGGAIQGGAVVRPGGPVSVQQVGGPAPRPERDVLTRVASSWASAPGGMPRFDGSERAFAETLAAVAEAFARGLVELKKGLKEFGEGIGVRAIGGHSPLHRSQAASELLAYLLDPNADTRQRLEQLVDLFADMMIHEVALLNGVKAGVRQLLTELDPEQGYARTEGGKSIGLFDRSLKKYSDYFKSVTEDDGQGVVFGSEFAQAYADALGVDSRKLK